MPRSSYKIEYTVRGGIGDFDRIRKSIGMKRIRGGMCVISDEMAYREYLEGREESADILVDRYGDALTYYIMAIFMIFMSRRI